MYTSDEPHCVTCHAVNGGWSTWSAWSLCSRTCDIGKRERRRTCDNPLPINGGLNCSDAEGYQSVNCKLGDCPAIPAHWSDWGQWTLCSVTCGDGSLSRNRTCIIDPTSSDTFPCVGDSLQTNLCFNAYCPGRYCWPFQTNI